MSRNGSSILRSTALTFHHPQLLLRLNPSTDGPARSTETDGGYLEDHGTW